MHGAGSFCGAAGPAHTERVSTLAEERQHNAALAAPDEETFVREQLSGLLAYPSYYRHMAPINLSGPPVLGRVPEVPALEADDVATRMDGGAWPVHTRWRGRSRERTSRVRSTSNSTTASAAMWGGWSPSAPSIVLVLREALGDAEEAAAQLFRIGYEGVEGYLAGGVESWRRSGRRLASYPVVGLDESAHGTARPARRRTSLMSGSTPSGRRDISPKACTSSWATSPSACATSPPRARSGPSAGPATGLPSPRASWIEAGSRRAWSTGRGSSTS